MNISIVIPTYNRTNQLVRVLKYVCEGEIRDFEEIEILVIDDGSTDPVEPSMRKVKYEHPVTVSYIRQENSGPAEARNRGFREAKHEIVLFIDDDILVTADLVKKHYLAHVENPGSVVYGSSPYAMPDKETASYRYLRSLTHEYEQDVSAAHADDLEYVPVDVVASGNISVEKHLFDDEVYPPGLSIPVSEEFALALKLRRDKVPIYFARNISGWHLQPATIRDSCFQNYKYGLGIAEVVAKMPEILELEQIERIYSHNTELKGFKGAIRKIATPGPIRKSLLTGIELMEKAGVPDRLLFRLFRFSVGNYFVAGIQDGIKRFGIAASEDR